MVAEPKPEAGSANFFARHPLQSACRSRVRAKLRQMINSMIQYLPRYFQVLFPCKRLLTIFPLFLAVIFKSLSRLIIDSHSNADYLCPSSVYIDQDVNNIHGVHYWSCIWLCPHVFWRLESFSHNLSDAASQLPYAPSLPRCKRHQRVRFCFNLLLPYYSSIKLKC